MSRPMPGVYSYSYEDDILYVLSKARSYDVSVEVDELVFDLDKSGKVVGVEIFNASNILNLPKEALRNLRSLKLEVVVGERIALRLQLKAVVRNGQRTGSFVLERDAPEHMQPSSMQLAVV